MKKLNFGQHQAYIYNTADEVKRATAEHIRSLCAKRAIHADKVSLALSGGSSPIGVYQNLLLDDPDISFPWQQMLIFFGDERYVAHDHSDSNYRMARETFLNAAPIPEKQIYPVPTDCEQAKICAQRYADQLAMLEQKDKVPIFDYILLGIGDDGHTASLFPGTSIIDEINKPVAAVYIDKLQAWRISLTFPVLNGARNCSVLACGEEKAAVLADVMLKDKNTYPVGRIKNSNGINWFIDQAAASRLTV